METVNENIKNNIMMAEIVREEYINGVLSFEAYLKEAVYYNTVIKNLRSKLEC